MKKITILAAAILMTISSFAQEKNTDEFRTIFGDQKLKVSGYGGFNMAFSSYNTYYAVETGGSMAVLFNKQLFVGGYGQSANIDRIVKLNNYDYRDVSLNHGGFWLGYIVLPNLPIHPVISTQAGWGKAKLDDSIKDYVFVINPTVEVELNVTRFFRIVAGGHYTFVSDVNTIDEMSSSDFSGPGGTLSFRFGWF